MSEGESAEAPIPESSTTAGQPNPAGDKSPAAGNPPLSAAAPRLSWLRTFARLACLRTVESAPESSPFIVIVFLCVSWLGAWVLIDRWQRQPDPQFSPDGIPLLAWYGLAALALAGLLRGASQPRPALGATLFLALGATPLPLLLMSVVLYTVRMTWFWALCGAAAVYVLVFLRRGLRAVTGRSQRTAAPLGVLFIAVFMMASDALDAIPDVWNPPETADAAAASEDMPADLESSLFEQADRIDAALEPVQRASTATSQAFFLGFAGVGDQKVFAQEIGLASRVLGERFNIGARRLSLINDARDLEGAPLASVSGLSYALQGLAARMDLDKDVLFLSISSHGSEEPSIAVSNSHVPLSSLTSADLDEALRESGIQWRVIIISACYAGGFIDALRDPRTVVITAAAKDRTSFGCSNDADLTYFGEAFYRDALPGARSLRAAFDTATAAIAARERRERETPSNPQAYFGTEIENKLQGFYR